MFYGLDSNGMGLFNKEEEDKNKTFFFTIKVGEQSGNTDRSRFEAENFIAKINTGENAGKEYLVSVGKNLQYTELFIFEENKINQKQTTSFLGSQMKNLRGSAITFDYNNINYALFCFKTSIDSTYYFYLRRLCFNSNELTSTNPTYKDFKKLANIGDSLSCYISESKYIYCCYIDQVEKTTYNWGMPYTTTTNYFCQIALNESLIEQKSSCFSEYINTDADVFEKCIYLKGEAGAFTYYNSYNFPVFLFKNFNKNISDFEEYLNRPYIHLDHYVNNYNIYFNNYCLKNDLIKITDNKLCFITSSNNNETLYIIFLNILNENDVVIRYYSINIFKLNKYKILLDMRGNLYKNFIALAFSYCRSEICYSDRNS
jgi:hypothetical protein